MMHGKERKGNNRGNALPSKVHPSCTFGLIQPECITGHSLPPCSSLCPLCGVEICCVALWEDATCVYAHKYVIYCNDLQGEKP